MKINLQLSSSEARAQVKKWGGKLRVNAVKSASAGMKEQARSMQVAAQANIRTKLGGKKLANTFRVKVYDKKTDKLPMLRAYSNVKWLGVHEKGAVIQGKLLIPINQQFGRKGATGKGFKATLEKLRRGGNTFFVKKKNGQVVLMAENIAEHDGLLRQFKSRHRKKQGKKRLKRGESIPIAVLVNKVTIPRRLNVTRIIETRIPLLISSIEEHLKKDLLK
jgi:hypothetical protein